MIGFRLNVQTVFDGMVRAIGESAVDLGGLTPEQWVHAEDGGKTRAACGPRAVPEMPHDCSARGNSTRLIASTGVGLTSRVAE